MNRYFWETQDTQPLPLLNRPRLTLHQMRELCRMSPYEVAMAAGVHYCLVVFMERGVACRKEDVARVVAMLSRKLSLYVGVEDIEGLRVRE